MIKANNIEGKYLEYKGQPLVRQDNEIYYGDLSRDYYLFMMIMNYKEEPKLKVQIPDKVMIQIIEKKTNMPVPDKQKVVNGLYAAFDLGTIWLERLTRE